MSISTLESFSSLRALDELNSESDERAARLQYMRGEFLAAAQRCDASAIATFAGTTTDFSNRLHGGGYGKRPQTVGEVVHDAMDNKRFKLRAMQVLLNAAAGRGTQRDAAILLDELATAWAQEQAE